MDTFDTNSEINEEEVNLKMVVEIIKRNIQKRNEMNIRPGVGTSVPYGTL